MRAEVARHPLRQLRIELGFGWLAVCHEVEDQAGVVGWLVSAIHPEIMRWEPSDGLPFTSRAPHAPCFCPYSTPREDQLDASVERLRRLVLGPLNQQVSLDSSAVSQ